MTVPAPFDQVATPSSGEYACSPPFSELDLDDGALKIALPPLVTLRPQFRLPMCLSLTASTRLLSQFSVVWDAITVVATDARTGALWVNNLGTGRWAFPDAPPDPNMRDDIETSYRNVDLAEVLQLPSVPARYWVHALFEGYGSDVLHVHVRA